MTPEARIALVSGSNRGIGLETCRQLARHGLTVILTSRDGTTGKAAADKLVSEGLRVVYRPLDVCRDDSIRKLLAFLRSEFGRLDVLINNAAIFPERTLPKSAASELATLDPEILRSTLETNLYGPLRLIQQALPLMRKGGYGRIVNVSAGLGRVSELGAGYPAYRISKAALNALTRIAAAESPCDNILINAVDPGGAPTRLGSTDNARSVAEAAAGIVWAATLRAGAPSGVLFRDGQTIAW